MREPVEITYADPHLPKLQRMVIKAVEGVTGRRALGKRYRRYVNEGELVTGPQAWDRAVNYLGVTFDAQASPRLKREGKGLLIIANHPFGVVDGIVLSWIASRIDPAFRVIAHGLLLQEPTLLQNLLPIDFSESKGANRRNVETRRHAIDMLSNGGVVGIFPAGAVSWSQRRHEPVRDEDWKPMTGKLIQASRCDVLPIRFHGKNSWPFQIASRHSQLLRAGLLLNEVRNKLDKPLQVEIGQRIDNEALPKLEPQALVNHLRAQLGV